MDTTNGHGLASLLPVVVGRRLLAGSPSEPVNRTIDTAVLVVDVSGFTQLVAGLAPEGDAGAERLSGVLVAATRSSPASSRTRSSTPAPSARRAAAAC